MARTLYTIQGGSTWGGEQGLCFIHHDVTLPDVNPPHSHPSLTILPSPCADYYERALLNGLIGNQNVQGPYTGDDVGFIYMLPLGPSVTKPWGSGINSGFPCCWGTLSETFAKLQDSIYFQSPPGAATPTLYVHLFVASTVTTDWGVTATQLTTYPENPAQTTQLQIDGSAATTSYTIAIRVPFWAQPAEASVIVDGQPVPAAKITPANYLNLTFTAGTKHSVTVFFPPYLRWEFLNDNRTQYATTGALFYGSVLLASQTSHPNVALPSPDQLATAIQRNMTDPSVLRFDAPAISQCGAVQLMPLYDVMFETYTVYLE